MPKVGKKHFAYTDEGESEAKRYSKITGGKYRRMRDSKASAVKSSLSLLKKNKKKFVKG